MRVCVGGRDVELTALRDTGNGLRDPVGGTPVLVAAPGALDGVLPRRVRQLLGMSLPRRTCWNHCGRSHRSCASG